MPRPTAEILRAFFRLGVTSFGGPIAHVGYFRREFVERRRWLDDAQFAQLLAIAQLLPGPASSQLGFGIGWLRGGWRGALAAFGAFTLPSALLMATAALVGTHRGLAAMSPALHALKLLAAVVVTDGLVRMARQLTPDVPRGAIALAAAVVLGISPGVWIQLAVLVIAATHGALRRTGRGTTSAAPLPITAPLRTSLILGATFAVGLTAALLWPTGSATLGGVAAAMWRAGALVFGGGHVVLPLLQQSVVATGWLPTEDFLAGYGLAQLVPGPMFSVAAYFGAAIPTGHVPWLGALAAVLAIFTPGFLLLAALLPRWSTFTSHPRATGAITGLNAAVVGLLAAALLNPILPAAVRTTWDLAALLAGLALQRLLPRPTFATLALCIAVAALTR